MTEPMVSEAECEEAIKLLTAQCERQIAHARAQHFEARATLRRELNEKQAEVDRLRARVHELEGDT